MVISLIKRGVSFLKERRQIVKQRDDRIFKNTGIKPMSPGQIATAIAPIGRIKVLGATGTALKYGAKTFSGLTQTRKVILSGLGIITTANIIALPFYSRPIRNWLVTKAKDPLAPARGIAGFIDTLPSRLSDFFDSLKALNENPFLPAVAGAGLGAGLGAGATSVYNYYKNRGQEEQFGLPPSISTGVPMQSPIEEEEKKEVVPVKPIKFKNVVNVTVNNRRTKKFINPLIVQFT